MTKYYDSDVPRPEIPIVDRPNAYQVIVRTWNGAHIHPTSTWHIPAKIYGQVHTQNQLLVWKLIPDRNNKGWYAIQNYGFDLLVRGGTEVYLGESDGNQYIWNIKASHQAGYYEIGYRYDTNLLLTVGENQSDDQMSTTNGRLCLRPHHRACMNNQLFKFYEPIDRDKIYPVAMSNPYRKF